MAHPHEELVRSATEALSKRDIETFLGYHTDDAVIHFPGRGPMAGDYKGKEQIGQFFQQQMQILDAPPEIDTHDILANDEHAVILNNVRASIRGQILEQRQIVVLHLRDDKISEAWLQFSEQQAMDEMAGQSRSGG